MIFTRRRFIRDGAALAASGSIARVLLSARPAAAHTRSFRGYGELVADPAGLIDLPAGFQYRVFSREGDPLSGGGSVPSLHDGMGAFDDGRSCIVLVRNHEVEPVDVTEDGVLPVPLLEAAVYDREAVGGTTTLRLLPDRRLVHDAVSLSGTSNNCAGGVTPWRTWLTCEETVERLGKAHGYVFEVDPLSVGNPEPIKAMGRFEHEAVAFDPAGTAYLTEDADSPHGCLYRFCPERPLQGSGSLHAGGSLAALKALGVDGDLSVVSEPGTRLRVQWIAVHDADPADDATPVREQAIGGGATPIMKAEGMWMGLDGSVWFVSSRGDGPDAEDEADRTAAAHAGQIWRYDPSGETIELIVQIPKDSPYDGVDNITVSPHGFILACTDGEDDQWLLCVDEQGEVTPFARNALNAEEFAGATFSPDGKTLFANIQGPPGLTLAIWGPWESARRS
jgi:uncharacterized protein